MTNANIRLIPLSQKLCNCSTTEETSQLQIHTSPLSAPALDSKGTPDPDTNEMSCYELI